jgi:hypothetical protein
LHLRNFQQCHAPRSLCRTEPVLTWHSPTCNRPLNTGESI